jgi:hypothetical protein
MIGKNDINREINEAEKQMLLDKYNTAMKKAKFLNEIKNGLGVDIKQNPGRAHIIKKTWSQKLILKLKSIFTKF